MIHQTFDVQGTPDIEVHVESGRIEVRRGPEGTVDVQVDTKASGFIVEQRGNSILVSSDKTTSWLSRSSAYVVIEAPKGSDLRASVASADIHASLPLGKVDLKTASGDIELLTADTLDVKSASGDLDIDRVDRSLHFTSASGDLRVREAAHGSVGASTASGDVHIDDCDATFDLNTMSGDARLMRFTGRNAHVKGMSGTIELGIPRRTEVTLDVNLLSGNLQVPEPETSPEEPERQMTIRAKLVSGDLRIERVD